MRNSTSANLLCVHIDDDNGGRSELDSGTLAAGPSKRQKHTGEETSLKMPDPAPPPHIRIQTPYFEIININDLSSSCSMDSAPIIDNPVPSSIEKEIQTNLRMPPHRITDFGVSVAGVPSNAPTMSWH